MIPFLKAVAEAYVAHSTDLSQLCMLFPNKRSGRFFLKYLAEALPPGHTVVAPDVVTISDLVQMLAGRIINSRIDSLLVLYRCYCDLRGLDPSKGGTAAADDFEHFRTWGETLLADFDEVDLYAVNPDHIFKNVKDFREISANFLTPAQRAVMEEYFGRSTPETDPADFWRDFGADTPGKDLTELRSKFVYLWQRMAPLYHALNRALDAEGLATMGGAYRLAADALKSQGRALLPWQHMGVVGFNALSARELSLFSSLASLKADDGTPFADFFWDSTGPVLTGPHSTATRFIAANRREFPTPAWAMPFIKRSDRKEMPPEINIVSSPSGAAQAKLVGETVARMATDAPDPERPFAEARTAVVVPDENLLLPLLYSLPPTVGDVNLTMGYSLRLTSALSFVNLLRICHTRQRKAKGHAGFHFEDVRTLMAHPYSHLLFGSEAVGALNEWISRYHPHVVTPDDAARFSPEMATVLRPLANDSTPDTVADYLENVLLSVKKVLEQHGSDGLVKSRLDLAHIDTYRDALNRLRDAMAERNVGVNLRTFLALADRMLATEKVNFEGEPLSGLQVMGLLETRSLDFDHLVIPSMNERIMPLKSRRRTFIPDTLRIGYGMPPSNFQESLFAYYFFRLISRAQSVTLLYDSRTGGGIGAGDVSRYILQLRHLYAKGQLKETERRFTITGRELPPADVEKDPDVMRRLEQFSTPRSGYNLSASALRKYCDCQARFFYETVLGLRTEQPTDQYMDAATQGTVLHQVIMALYLPDPNDREHLLDNPLQITPEHIKKLIADTQNIDTLLRRAINQHHFHRDAPDLDRPLKGETAMVAQELHREIIAVLNHDLQLAPFSLLGCEIKQLVSVPVDGRPLNIKMAIDRLDIINDPDGQQVLRVIDYKTGSVSLTAASMDDVFGTSFKAHNIFQLLFYAWMLQKTGLPLPGNPDVRTEIYDIKTLAKSPRNITDDDRRPRLPEIAEIPITAYSQVASEFGQRMEGLVKQMFNPKEPFRAAPDLNACTFCALKPLCGR